MGCGQSKIGLYQRKHKNKANGKRSGEEGESEEEPEEADKTNQSEINTQSDNDEMTDSDVLSNRIKELSQQQNTGGVLLPQSDISSSQLDFFKMLDEKIENGPDYIEDEEQEKARLIELLQEWKSASVANHQKSNGHVNTDSAWPSPTRTRTQDDYNSYPPRVSNSLDTQRFPTGYSSCPPNPDISMHLHNTYRPQVQQYPEQPRIRPMNPLPRQPFQNYNEYQDPRLLPMYNHCEDTNQESIRTFPHVLVRQNSQPYQENQRLYQDVRLYPQEQQGYYPEQRGYPVVARNIHMVYRPELQQQQQPQPQRQYVEPQRYEPQRSQDQRIYHERRYQDERNFQRPPLLTQRSFQEPRTYRDVDNDYQRPYQERYVEEQRNIQSPLKLGRAASMDMQYINTTPPPMEIIPLQVGPGPPQGSPRPIGGRGIPINRLPSVVQFRKARGAFTELA